MSSLLRPLALESCQNGLRERRRSSIHPLNDVPRLFLNGPSPQEDVAVFDDAEQPECVSANKTDSRPHFIAPTLSTLSHAHMSDYASKVTIPRHQNALPPIDVYDIPTPGSSSPPITLDSRKPSFMTLYEECDSDHPDNHRIERLRWRLASGYFAYFMCGWGDGVTGTVLPYFAAEFNISSMMTSLLYAGSTIGFIFGTLIVESIINQLGRFVLTRTQWTWLPQFSCLSWFQSKGSAPKQVGFSKSQSRLLAILISSILHGLFFVLMGSKGGFWVLFSAYALAAFARSILTASLNEYFAESYEGSLGYSFGIWSIGGMASPLVCQALMASGVPWFQFYFGSLVLSAANTAFLVMTFKPTIKEFHRDREYALQIEANTPSGANTPTKELPAEVFSPMNDLERKQETDTTLPGTQHALRLALSLRYQWAVCIFGSLYCGSETATQAFMVTYLLGTRNAPRNTVGYVTSGFWGGISIGRFLWGYYSPRLNYVQRRYITLGCLRKNFRLISCSVNSNIQNAFSTSIIGLAYGPLFPAILAMANDLLPAEVRMISMGLISAAASVGAALFPFAIGTLSSSMGIKTMPYITVPLAGVITVLWVLFPSKAPSR
ncbi:major facilitator superfamily domain-containing protein [Crassisporium funariophilum]|nr:major facilitator superfamily domain-containing protein [Crassisporium funariophilum]